ncbi:PilZ domain protein (plasmid) [Marinobacter salarius]|uniref:PilZ domain protein n=1 Tax=Marinobacter salarius TaxID=1420917 RepID=A0A1W6KFC1_9GAMM|nr:PilZ domain protein [Marinobacter salarius]
MTNRVKSTASQPDTPTVYDRSDSHFEDVSLNLRVATEQLYQEERRLNSRVAMRGCTLKIRPLNQRSTNQWIEVTPEDFSRGGLKFTTDVRLNKGDKIWLLVKPDQGITGINPFQIGGIVKHISPAGDKSRIGAQFHRDMIKDYRRIELDSTLEKLENFLSIIERAAEE